MKASIQQPILRLLTCYCTALLAALFALPASATPDQADRADAFVDSIGVNIHLPYRNVYTNYNSIIKPRLLELGVRHVREMAVPGWGSDAARAKTYLMDLGSNGISCQLICDPRWNSASQTTIAAKVNESYTWITGIGTNYVDAIEGPNEPDGNSYFATNNFGGTVYGTWTNGCVVYCTALWNKFTNSSTATLQILAPSIANFYLYSSYQAQRTAHSIPAGAQLDYGNLHTYPGGTPSGGTRPSWSGRGISLNSAISMNRVMLSSGQTMIASEAGYHNAVSDPNSHTDGISEAAAGKYYSRLWFEFFNRGIQRTFAYEFADEGTAQVEQQRYGLLQNNGTRKPAFNVTRDIITLLEDPAANAATFSPGTLGYTLTGSTNNVITTLLQKADNTYYLMLWLDVESYNSTSNIDLNPTAQSVTIVPDSGTSISSAAIYYPYSNGTTSTQSFTSPANIPISVKDHVVIVEIHTAPDLIVTGISRSPGSLVSGQPVTFSATVKNQGIAPTPAGTILGVKFSIDGTTVNWEDTNTVSLAAGASRTLTADGGPSGTSFWTAVTGVHTVVAYVDDVDRITESNESNNTLTNSITVLPLPPVAPTGLAATSGDAQVGLTWNTSSGATSYNVKRATVSGGPYTTIFSPTVNSYTDTTALNGVNYFYVVSAVNSGGESANSSQVSATPVGGPSDLIVTSVSWSPTSPVSGQAVSFSATVKNQGTGPTPSGVILGVKFSVDGTTVNWEDTNTVSLAPGASRMLTANNGPTGASTWTATIGTHTLVAYVDDVNRITESNESNNTLTNSVTVTLLPSPWQTADIGTVGATGSSTWTNNVFTVVGSGADIFGTADEFRYTYQTASGDCTIVARVTAVQNVDVWSKAGVMIRETLNTNSTHCSMYITPGSGASYQSRITTGGTTAGATTAGITAPRWVKVVRTGNTFTASYSSDGSTWTTEGTTTITMGTNVYIGLAVTSHVDGTLCTATFDNVTAAP